MKIYVKLLYSVVLTTLLAAKAIGCASTGVNNLEPYDQDLSQLSSAYDSLDLEDLDHSFDDSFDDAMGFDDSFDDYNPSNDNSDSLFAGSNVLVIADAKNDSSSVSFYSCPVSEMEAAESHNSSVDVEKCVNVFRLADGKPLTISKQSLQSLESQDSLPQDLDQLEKLYKSDLNDMEIKKASSHLTAALLGLLVVAAGISTGIALSASVGLESQALAPALLIPSIAGLLGGIALTYGLSTMIDSGTNEKTHGSSSSAESTVFNFDVDSHNSDSVGLPKKSKSQKNKP
ncbi:MAG: hypothetical protein OXC44_00190 [Proteobacteria bacterium]|nr:hypothetical protein [Pseudomonadota bacterium]